MTATLQMLLDEKIGLYYRCKNGHSEVLDAETLAYCLGANRPIPDVAEHIMCPVCGSWQVEVQPDWPSKGPGKIVEPVP